jgi:predicted aspartyl protease
MWLAAWIALSSPPGLVVSASSPAPAPSASPEPEYAVSTRLDWAGRVLAPVMVNDQGPFRFILDTGANRSVLSPRLVATLGLDSSAHAPVSVHGVTGIAVLPAVQVARMQAGDVVLQRDRQMPVLTRPILADADGVLGVEGLGSARIDIDFADDRVTIAPSSGRPRADPGFITIPATLHNEGLLMVAARVGRVRTKAIIDTGAERTLGNAALRNALLLTPRRGAEPTLTTVLGATPALGEGMTLVAPTIYLGQAELKNLEVTFADLHVFRIWNLEREPAILIGMDLLGTVERLIIDYRRREIQIKP